MIELQPFSGTDCDRLIGWVPNARFLLQWAGPKYSWPLDTHQLEATLRRSYKHPPPCYVFRAIDRDSTEIIGHIELVHVDYDGGSGHIGRVLVGPLECRGKGYGKQILSELIVFAFDSLDLNRLTLRVFDFNQPAIRCYQSLGFRQIELKKNARRFRDEFCNTILMELDRLSWRARNTESAEKS